MGMMLHSGITTRERFGSRLSWTGVALFAVSLAIGVGVSEPNHELSAAGKAAALGLFGGLGAIVTGFAIMGSEHFRLSRMGII